MKPGILITGTMREKVDAVVGLARDGVFGTPDNKNRGGSGKNIFWNVYDGLRDAKYYRGGINYPYARAAEILRGKL